MEVKSLEKIWTGQFIVMVLNNFFLFILQYALLTVLPVFILSDLNGTAGQAGLALTLFMLSAIIVRPFAGKIIEKFGKRKTLLVSELLFCLSAFLYVFMDSLSLLLALRLFHGISFSILTTVIIAIANDIIPDSRKGTGLGYFGLSMNLAIILGPFTGLMVLQLFSYKILVIGLAIIVSIGYLFALTLKVSENAPQPLATTSTRFSWQDLFEIKAIPIAIVGCLTAVAYASIMSFISVFAEARGVFEYVSLFFVVFAIAMMVVRPYTGHLYDTKGPNSVIYPSLILFAVGLFLISTMHTVLVLLIAAVFIGIGYGSLIPCFQAYAIQSAEKHRSSHATSTFFTLFDLGMATGAFVLGIVSAQWGYSALYIVCGIIVVLTIPVYRLIINKKSTKHYHEPMLVKENNE